MIGIVFAIVVSLGLSLWTRLKLNKHLSLAASNERDRNGKIRDLADRLRPFEARYAQSNCTHCYCRPNWGNQIYVVYQCCKGCGAFSDVQSKVCTETPAATSGQKKAK